VSSIARISLDTEAGTELTGVWRALPGLGSAVSELAERVYDYAPAR
jgi:hypothetical protein